MDEGKLDKNLMWTGIIYFVGLYLLHTAWWQALVVAAAMTISWFLTCGRPIIVGVGLLVFLLDLGSWSGLIPGRRNGAAQSPRSDRGRSRVSIRAIPLEADFADTADPFGIPRQLSCESAGSWSAVRQSTPGTPDRQLQRWL
jgi:hypothetical protein